jgi:hypothetical protein
MVRKGLFIASFGCSKRMIRLGKISLCLALWLATASCGWAFALMGQFPAWQTATYSGFLLDYAEPGDIGGPQRPNEGYRWNVPVITYAFDKTFLNYFGARGVREVEKAIAIFNNLPAMTEIHDNGFRILVNGRSVPFDTLRLNPEAEALGLLDLKSMTMKLLIEELGLADPERWAWTLAGSSRGGTPRITNYTVFQLNFDPISIRPSSFVNNVLYSFQIFEFTNPDRAIAIEFPESNFDFSFSSVAGFEGFGPSSFGVGRFYTGLTHDDVGGLRWLYNTNNLAVEGLLTNVIAGRAVTGNSPWAPFFSTTNTFATGTNFIFQTNLLVRQALRPGQNKLTFRKVEFDSLLGNLFIPFTNRYTDTYFTNARAVIQPVERIIDFPDIFFTAERLGLAGNLIPALTARTSTTNWINNDAINGYDGQTDGGPGVIQGPVKIAFSDQLPYFTDVPFTIFFGPPVPGLPTDPFVDPILFTSSVIWGSFDGTTDAPFIYPVYGDITIEDLRQSTAGGGN